MAWIQYNANPTGKQVGDCTVRAISKATDQTWEDAYSGMALQGFLMNDMPSANHVWGSYLKRNAFQRHMIPDSCPDCYTVKDFCRDHPKGTFIVALHGHVIAVKDGNYYDTFDSGEGSPIYYYERKE